MDFYTFSETLEILSNKAVEKTKLSLWRLVLLGFMGGSFIALGFLAYVRTVGTMPGEWGSFASFLGATVFPVGLVGIVLVGGELTTGNMMTMSLGYFQKKTSLGQVFYNWLIVMATNALGGIAVAFFFGHFVGLTEGAFLAKTIAIGQGKVMDTPMVALVSGIGCNIFVCMAVWISTSAKTFTSKFIFMWFPVMVFVIVGFQHVVANAFIIPAAIFAGGSEIGWMDYLKNLLFVFIGNGIGGALAFALPCHILYHKSEKSEFVSERQGNEKSTSDDFNRFLRQE